jgi:hypothetical protein
VAHGGPFDARIPEGEKVGVHPEDGELDDEAILEMMHTAAFSSSIAVEHLISFGLTMLAGGRVNARRTERPWLCRNY